MPPAATPTSSSVTQETASGNVAPQAEEPDIVVSSDSDEPSQLGRPTGDNESAVPSDSETDDDSDSEASFQTAEADEEVEDHPNILSRPNTVLNEFPQERDPYSHLTSMQRGILLYLYNLDNDEEREEGTHVENIVWALRARGADITGLGQVPDHTIYECLLP